MWQFAGLLQRSLDRHSDALRSFAEASRLAPLDASIAHGYAQVTLEAGLDAVDRFQRALQLAPNNHAAFLGLISAKFAAGYGAEAESQLDRSVERNPLWVEGHNQLAQLRSMLGVGAPIGASIDRALAVAPTEESLWTALLNLALTSELYAELDRIAVRARSSNVRESLIAPFEAIAASEQGDVERADQVIESLDGQSREGILLWRVRHLLRAGRADEALSAIDDGLRSDNANEFWPYAEIAWRLTADPRWHWLAPSQLIQEIDLSQEIPRMEELKAVLRSLHLATGGFLDQSVRRGTQTDGPLLSRIEPEIQMLRSAIVEGVSQYRHQLGPIDPAHPSLGKRRDRRVRFAGSWSVRLQRAGYHVSHVHPKGWISSALYIALPPETQGPDNAGFLTFGDPPPTLRLGLAPIRLVEPQVAKLVLFPSWLWHGTVPIGLGERLTVAFDVQ